MPFGCLTYNRIFHPFRLFYCRAWPMPQIQCTLCTQNSRIDSEDCTSNETQRRRLLYVGQII